jgi:hypothetical protein
VIRIREWGVCWTRPGLLHVLGHEFAEVRAEAGVVLELSLDVVEFVRVEGRE